MAMFGKHPETKTVSVDMTELEARQLYASMSLLRSLPELPEANKKLAVDFIAQISNLLDEDITDVPYSNAILTTILRKITVETSDTFVKENVKVIEDTPTKWAIHTNEEYYYTIHNIVKDVCQEKEAIFKAASTSNPDWDVFCSA